MGEVCSYRCLPQDSSPKHPRQAHLYCTFFTSDKARRGKTIVIILTQSIKRLRGVASRILHPSNTMRALVAPRVVGRLYLMTLLLPTHFPREEDNPYRKLYVVSLYPKSKEPSNKRQQGHIGATHHPASTPPHTSPTKSASNHLPSPPPPPHTPSKTPPTPAPCPQPPPPPRSTRPQGRTQTP